VFVMLHEGSDRFRLEVALGHINSVKSIAISPVGEQWALAYDETVELFDSYRTDTGMLLQEHVNRERPYHMHRSAKGW